MPANVFVWLASSTLRCSACTVSARWSSARRSWPFSCATSVVSAPPRSPASSARYARAASSDVAPCDGPAAAPVAPAPSAAPVVRAFAARESASGGVGARDDTVSSRCRNDSRGAGAARSPSTPRRAPISGIVCRRALATRATSADRTPPGPDARRAPAAVTAGVLLMDEVR
ncbi:hypothetical protein X949_5030 [Burkholderia pseudomallei MSHR5609]|nr:hypothetical protein X949_5030 [Burkholderia pseudomallei MSHR5609]